MQCILFLLLVLYSYSIKPILDREMCFVTINTQMFVIHTEPWHILSLLEIPFPQYLMNNFSN